MQTITASQIKQNSTILQNALREDLLVTKRNAPFVVVMDYQRYEALMRQAAYTHPDHHPRQKKRSLEAVSIDTSGYRFDRDEAHER